MEQPGPQGRWPSRAGHTYRRAEPTELLTSSIFTRRSTPDARPAAIVTGIAAAHARPLCRESDLEVPDLVGRGDLERQFTRACNRIT